MSTLSNLPLPTTIDAFILTTPDPTWLTGQAWREGDVICAEFQHIPSVVKKGNKLIMNFPQDESPIITLEIDSIEGNRVKLKLSDIRERDKRSFPRHFGNIPLLYRTVSEEEEELVSRQWKHNTISSNDTRA